jgi:hypothetical protein
VTLLIVTALGLVGYGAFKSYTAGAQSTRSTLSVDDNQKAAAAVPGAGLMSVIDRIYAIQLDKKVFDDPVLQSLRDNTVTLPVPSVGRPNPFAPTTAAPAPSTSGKKTTGR